MEPSTPDPIVAFLKDRDEPCPKCNYNLRNAAAGVCPECGAVLRLMVDRPGFRRIVYRLAGIVLVGGLAARTWDAVAAIWVFRWSPPWFLIVHAVGITISALWCVACLIEVVRRRGSRIAAGRILLMGALGLAALELAKFVVVQIGILYFRRW